MHVSGVAFFCFLRHTLQQLLAQQDSRLNSQLSKKKKNKKLLITPCVQVLYFLLEASTRHVYNAHRNRIFNPIADHVAVPDQANGRTRLRGRLRHA